MSRCINIKHAEDYRIGITNSGALAQKPNADSDPEALERSLNLYYRMVDSHYLSNPYFKDYIQLEEEEELWSRVETAYGTYFPRLTGLRNNEIFDNFMQRVKNRISEVRQEPETEEDTVTAYETSYVHTLFTPTGVALEEIVDKESAALEYEDLQVTTSGEFTQKVLGDQEMLSLYFNDWVNKQMFKTLIFDQDKGHIVFEEKNDRLVNAIEDFIRHNKDYVDQIPLEKKQYFNSVMKGKVSPANAEQFTNWVINNGREINNTSSDFHDFMAYAFSMMPKAAPDRTINHINVYNATGCILSVMLKLLFCQ